MVKINPAADYYALLEVHPNASNTVIQKAYRALVQQYHPDHHGAGAVAEERLKQINEAYAVLSDATLRQQYDQSQRRTKSKTSLPTANRFIMLFVVLGALSLYWRLALITPLGKFVLLLVVGWVYFRWVKPSLKPVASNA